MSQKNFFIFQWMFVVILILLLLTSCNPLPVTPLPTSCPWWGCGATPDFRPTSTPEPTLTSAPHRATSIPNTPPKASDTPTLSITATPLPSPTGGPLTCRFQVSAYEHSTARQYLDTGMEINPGANLVIEASGTACFGLESDHCNGPDGHPAFNDTDLVGKFSGGDQFHIGSSFQLTMGGEGGRLYLGFNDTDYDNNRGYFDVTVMVDNTFTRICTP